LANLVVQHGVLILPDRCVDDGMLIAIDGIITYAGKSRSRYPKDAVMIDAKGGFISPGFIDIHVHGGLDADFMDGTTASVETTLRCHAAHGTTTLFPTSTTGPREQIMAMLRATGDVQARWTPELGSRIAGVHLYGPYFAADKVGCHRVDGRREPERAEYQQYFETKLIKIATCAAELKGAADFYKAARKHGCLITCGHSNSTWPEMEQAFRLGMRHVDHFWCAMSSVQSLRPRCGTPMQASMEQFVIANEQMSTEVIADGCHLSLELLRFAYQMKGCQKLCLVTDSSRALDMPPGEYRFGCIQDGPLFLHDGQVGRTLDGKGLASSTAGMDRMIRVMAKATRAPIHEVIRMASLTPAELTGIDKDLGSLEQGKRADVVVLNKQLRTSSVYIDGQAIRSGRR
jgi:N-acetylglucosamine-6-phosphate deacetylase